MYLKIIMTGILVLTGINNFVLAQGTETHLTIRARAMDAKFIGTSMGGAYIAVKNAETGEILDFGLTKGTTGNTRLLMETPQKRYLQISDGEAAKFETTLLLEEPMLVTIEAKAPVVQPQAAVTVTKQMWVIPGKHVQGDGIIVEIPGFALDLLSPPAHSSVSPGSEGIPVRANIVMMCGCPTSDGGMWDSSQFDIQAVVKKGGAKIGSFPLEYTGTRSQFEGTFKPAEPGVYQLTVFAFDPRTGNAGVDKTSVIVR